MNGFERLKEQVKGHDDKALIKTVDYLLSRKEMEHYYLKEEKTVDVMKAFIIKKANKYMQNGWNYIDDKVIYSWAIMYFSLPDSFLKITRNTSKSKIKNVAPQNINNVVSLEMAKKNMEQKKELEQISLFGGINK